LKECGENEFLIKKEKMSGHDIAIALTGLVGTGTLYYVNQLVAEERRKAKPIEWFPRDIKKKE
jgi:hypothetical protein